MKILEDVKEMLEDELKEIKKKGTRTPAEYEFIKTAVETIGKIDDICEKDWEDEGYSGRTYPHMNMRYNGRYSGRHDMMPMDMNWDGYSGGRYYGNNMPMDYYDPHYSGRRYSGHAEASDRIVREMRRLLDKPMSEREREVIMGAIDDLSR